MPRRETGGLDTDRACEIAEECYDDVLAYCRRHAPAGHEAADLAQETFLRFVRARGYRERGKPIAYLMRIARSVCVDACRERRLKTASLEFEVAAGERDGREADLDLALERLPGELREIVELRFGLGLGVSEVAQALGISRFAARRRIKAALKVLEEDLKVMGKAERSRLKIELSQHYSAQREKAGPNTIDSLARAMAAEDARISRARGRRMGFAPFVASQVRYVPPWTWVAQLGIVALMLAAANSTADASFAKLVVGVLSAATVLVGVPSVHASKLHDVAELEYSCPSNAASVMVARLIVLGCSSSLVVALMVGAVASSLDADALSVALCACPPFFCSCAGSLALIRRAAPSSAAVLCWAWAAACCAVLIALASMWPDMYGTASLASWIAAAAAALAWLVREVAVLVRAASAGLDAFSPQMAKTYH